MSEQSQFLQVVDVDQATKTFESHIHLKPVGSETIPVREALGRILAANVASDISVPGFDRSNFDGYCVRARDIEAASETNPVELRITSTPIVAGTPPIETSVQEGQAISIATGAMLPRGANAIVMVEDTKRDDEKVFVTRSVSPGFGISFAGSDIAEGQVVAYSNSLITSRESGTFAAMGMDHVSVWRKPAVAVISTGGELIPPGQPPQTAKVFDSNARILSDTIRECGGIPMEMGIAVDDIDELERLVSQAVSNSDIVVLSGGTSKGEGDISFRVVQQLKNPGLLVHGVALKPGKPVCLAVTNGTPVVVLPGFPTSAVFTFHQFVAPVVRTFAGVNKDQHPVVTAELAMRVNSAIGRTEYCLVSLIRQRDDSSLVDSPDDEIQLVHPRINHVGFPMGKGSGSVTAFSQADGFFVIDRNQEFVNCGEEIQVHLLNDQIQTADLVFAGSHCSGTEWLLQELQANGMRSKRFWIGSTSGLGMVEKGLADIGGIHLLDEKTDEYNSTFLTEDLQLIRGYRRRQGFVFRKHHLDRDLEPSQFIEWALANKDHVMVNRNQGSGTRILIDRQLAGAKPNGYWNASSNHHAVVAAIAQRRADWGIAIEHAAYALPEIGFIPISNERYDFVVKKSALGCAAVLQFKELIESAIAHKQLAQRFCFAEHPR